MVSSSREKVEIATDDGIGNDGIDDEEFEEDDNLASDKGLKS